MQFSPSNFSPKYSSSTGFIFCVFIIYLFVLVCIYLFYVFIFLIKS